MINYVERFTIV